MKIRLLGMLLGWSVFEMEKNRQKGHENSNLSNITQKWVDLLVPLTSDYSKKFYASELSRKTSIPQQTASRQLNMLAKVNLISYRKEGKNKIFYIDLEKQNRRTLLNLIESYKALLFQLETKHITVVVDEILSNCESLIIFGSYASGRFNEKSDLDLLVLGKHNKPNIKGIKQRQVFEINEHYASYKEFAKILKLKNPLALEIRGNHVLFGNISKIVDIFWRDAHE